MMRWPPSAMIGVMRVIFMGVMCVRCWVEGYADWEASGCVGRAVAAHSRMPYAERELAHQEITMPRRDALKVLGAGLLAAGGATLWRRDASAAPALRYTPEKNAKLRL